MDPIFDKFLMFSILFISITDFSANIQYIGTVFTLTACWLYNRYSYMLDDIDYFPDDVTFVDEKKAFR